MCVIMKKQPILYIVHFLIKLTRIKRITIYNGSSSDQWSIKGEYKVNKVLILRGGMN